MTRRLLWWWREITLVFLVFLLWQLLLWATQRRDAGAYSNGLALWRLERLGHFAVEPAVQSWSRAVGAIPALNVFYACAMFVALLAVMVWLAARHRAAYPAFRWSTLAVTGVSFLVQLVPVAPLRVLHVGLVDTAARAGDSVYTDQHSVRVGQLSAFPSLHVAWAALVALWVWRCAPLPVRPLGPLFLVLTVWAVVATGNHSVVDCCAGLGLVLVVDRLALGRERCRAW